MALDRTPRTPPRRRHRGKSSQSPRSTKRSSSSRGKPEEKLQAFLEKQRRIKNDKLKQKAQDQKKKEKKEKPEAEDPKKKEKKEKPEADVRKRKSEKKEKPEAEDPKTKKEKKEKPGAEDPKKKEKKEKPEVEDPKKKKEKKEKPEAEDPKKKKTEKKEKPEAEDPKTKKEKKEKPEAEDPKKKEKKEKPDAEDRKTKKEKKEKPEAEDPKKKEKKEKAEVEDPKKKDKDKIVYVPCERAKIAPIFVTPQAKKTTPSTASSQGMTSKEKAEAHLESLKEIMADSEDDSLSALDETDLDNFVKDMQEVNSEDEEDEEEGEDEDEEEGEQENEKQEEGEQEDEKQEDSTSEASEEEKEEDEEDEEESEESEAEEDESIDGESLSEEEAEEEKKNDEAGEEKQNKEKQNKESHALVPVTAATTSTVAVLRNSTSDKNAWDSFTRQLKGKAPIAVSQYASAHANKVELFNMWMDSDKSWDKCEVLLERKMQKKNEGTKGWQAIQGKTLAEQFQEEKWIKIRDSRKASGMWYPDEDFPDDDLEPRFNCDWSFLIWMGYPKSKGQKINTLVSSKVKPIIKTIPSHVRKRGTSCVWETPTKRKRWLQKAWLWKQELRSMKAWGNPSQMPIPACSGLEVYPKSVLQLQPAPSRSLIAWQRPGVGGYQRNGFSYSLKRFKWWVVKRNHPSH